MSDLLFYVYDKNQDPVFEVTIERDERYTETSCNFSVREIISWEKGSDNKWNVPSEYEDYLSAYIKWDGCSHFRFGEKDEDGSRDGYQHLCGAEYIKRHCELLEILYKRAFKEMNRDPEDEAWTDEKTLVS